MKTKYLILTFLLFIILINTSSALPNDFTYETTSTFNTTNITNIISTKSGYSIIESNKDTILYSYNKENYLIATKKIPSLTNATLTNYNDYLIVAGQKGNNLTIYLLDTNLRVLKYQETSSIISKNSIINIDTYNNKIYLNITKNNILTTNTIYEIDADFNITSNNFSSYQNIKKIITSNYDLIKYNTTTLDNNIVNYYSTTSLNNKTYIVGNSNDQALLSIYDNNELLSYQYNEQYTRYSKIIVIKNYLAILAYDENDNSYLLFADNTGQINYTEPLNLNGNPISSIYRVGDKLLITYKDHEKTYLESYNYRLSISYENLPYGTITISNSGTEYAVIPLTITPNSGYEITSITVTDAHGNILPLMENTFIMPDTDVMVYVAYNSVIENPNTLDPFYIITFILIISIISFFFFYKKYAWLH